MAQKPTSLPLTGSYTGNILSTACYSRHRVSGFECITDPNCSF